MAGKSRSHSDEVAHRLHLFLRGRTVTTKTHVTVRHRGRISVSENVHLCAAYVFGVNWFYSTCLHEKMGCFDKTPAALTRHRIVIGYTLELVYFAAGKPSPRRSCPLIPSGQNYHLGPCMPTASEVPFHPELQMVLSYTKPYRSASSRSADFRRCGRYSASIPNASSRSGDAHGGNPRGRPASDTPATEPSCPVNTSHSFFWVLKPPEEDAFHRVREGV